MNTKQKSALCCGLVASLVLIALHAVNGRSFVVSRPGFSFAIPWTRIIIMDPKLEWNFIALVIFVVAPATAACVASMRDEDKEEVADA